MTSYLLISRLRIHNANAMSSTLTIGVPAMTAWLGAIHGLERKLSERKVPTLEGIHLIKTAVSYHKTNLQIYKGPGDYVNSLIGTANPLNEKGKRPSFIEEARIHLSVSLLVEVKGLSQENCESFEQAVKGILPQMKMAGGDILDVGKIKVMYADEDDPLSIRKVIFALMPGYVVIERRDLMKTKDQECKDSLERLLHYLKVHQTTEKDEFGKVTGWKYERAADGWIAPIAVGFKGLSSLGNVKKQRDPSLLHRFAESIITLGEFKMAYRFHDIDDMMWRYAYEETDQLYLCKNQE